MMKKSAQGALNNLDGSPFTLDKAKEAGVRIFCNALCCQDRFNGKNAFLNFQKILNFTEEHLDEMKIIKDKNDLDLIKNDEGSIGTLLLLENADPLIDKMDVLSEMRELGIRIVGLTHEGKNRLGDGNSVPHPDGLSQEGKELILNLVKNRILLDIAHLHPKCFWQLFRLTDAPVISSHTGIKRICDIPRNIDFDQLNEIFERGGMVGISFSSGMLSSDGRASIEDVFIHIDVVVQKFGPDGVGLGSGFCGALSSAKGLEDITKIAELKEIMLEHGYGEDGVGKIMGLNWLRLIESLF
jgi:membrane dipeptidase